MDESDRKECETVLEEFFARADTEPFHVPVDWKQFGLFDYPEIVKKPMDLGTIKKKMNQYKTVHEFVQDMRLIWSNCMLYNEDGSDFHALAKHLSKVLEQRVKALEKGSKGAKGANSVASAPEPTLDDKTEFSQNIYKISSEDLGQVVHLLDEKCPTALDKTNPDELEIDIDSIDAVTFQAVDEFVKEALLSTAPKTTGKKRGRPRKHKDEDSTTKKAKT